jgi:hypothetical protein
VTARHQIGLTVSAAAENTLRFQPFPVYGMAGLTRHFSHVSAAVSGSVQAGLDGDGDGDTAAPSPGGGRFTFARAASHDPPVSMTAAARTAETATIATAPGVPDEPHSGKEPGLTEKPRQTDVGRARSVIVMHTGLEYLVEPTPLKPREVSAPAPTAIGSPHPGPSRDGEVEQNPRGMRLGTEYSFGLRFILDTDGFWRIRWF